MITRLRDEAPIANLSSLVPHCHVMEIRIEASKAVREGHRRLRASGHAVTSVEREPSVSSTQHADFIFENGEKETPGSRILPKRH